MELLLLAYKLCGGGGGGTSRSLTAGEYVKNNIIFFGFDSVKKMSVSYIEGLTDTSRGADRLVSLVAITDKIISQELHMVLLPRVYSDKKKPKCK